jgi:hypothetical protein
MNNCDGYGIIRDSKAELLKNYERIKKNVVIPEVVSDLIEYLDKEVEYLWSVKIEELERRNQKLVEDITDIGIENIKLKQGKAELMEINTCLYSRCDRLEKQNKELMDVAESHMALLLNGEDVSFGNEHDQAEGERIWLLLNKYKESEK